MSHSNRSSHQTLVTLQMIMKVFPKALMVTMMSLYVVIQYIDIEKFVLKYHNQVRGQDFRNPKLVQITQPPTKFLTSHQRKKAKMFF